MMFCKVIEESDGFKSFCAVVAATVKERNLSKDEADESVRAKKELPLSSTLVQ
jgi:hypothetical protein